MSQFLGMSSREASLMPYLNEATALKLGLLDRGDWSLKIASAQEAYVHAVWGRCPRWRWWKNRQLRRACGYATKVRRLVEMGRKQRERPAREPYRPTWMAWHVPGGVVFAREHERYEGLRGQERIALVDPTGRVEHFDAERVVSSAVRRA